MEGRITHDVMGRSLLLLILILFKGEKKKRIKGDIVNKSTFSFLPGETQVNWIREDGPVSILSGAPPIQVRFEHLLRSCSLQTPNGIHTDSIRQQQHQQQHCLLCTDMREPVMLHLLNDGPYFFQRDRKISANLQVNGRAQHNRRGSRASTHLHS